MDLPHAPIPGAMGNRQIHSLIMMRVGATVCRANDDGKYDPDYNVSSAVMLILKDDSYHREVVDSILMNFDVPAARGFSHMQEDHYSKGSGMDDDYLDDLQELDHGKRGGSKDDESDTDDYGWGRWIGDSA
jgi:hypothetical protein